MVNGTLLHFGKRYKDDLRVIFDLWQKLHLGLDALSNQKNVKRYLLQMYYTLILLIHSWNFKDRITYLILNLLIIKVNLD
jgi:hypothetical protein